MQRGGLQISGLMQRMFHIEMVASRPLSDVQCQCYASQYFFPSQCSSQLTSNHSHVVAAMSICLMSLSRAFSVFVSSRAVDAESTYHAASRRYQTADAIMAVLIMASFPRSCFQRTICSLTNSRVTSETWRTLLPQSGQGRHTRVGLLLSVSSRIRTCACMRA